MAIAAQDSLAPTDKQRLREQGSFYFRYVLGIEPFQYQEEFIDDDSKRKQLCCGRQVGKTEICAGDGLHDATVHDGHEVLIVAPTQRQSSNLFRRVKTMRRESPVEDWGVTRETQTIIEFGNGSRIICLPAGTDGSTIRGYTADYIIVDEAAFVPDEVFSSVLNPMLATTDGTMILASTPFGTSGFFYEASLSERWTTLQVPTAESPLVDESFIEEQRQALSSLEFEQEILGEFCPDTDKLFYHKDVRACAVEETNQWNGVSVDIDPSDADEPVFLGCDLARHGADSSVFIGLSRDGDVFLVQTIKDAPLTDAMGRIGNLQDQFDFKTIAIDENSIGGGVVDTLTERYGGVIEGVKFTIDTKQSMFNALKTELEDRSLRFPYESRIRPELIDLEYEFTSTGKMKVHHPDGGHDDHADALALALHARNGYSTAGGRVYSLDL